MSYSLEEKLEAIALVEQGETARSVSNKLHLGHHVLYEWLELYRQEGISGLKEKHNRKIKKHLSYKQKCQIIRKYHESELTLCQISAVYGVSSSTLSKWLSDVAKDGMEALRRKKSETHKIGMARTKRLPKEEYEKENEHLRKENERLRLENLLLKKVRALVEEREARNKAIGRKPSKN